jgi:osmoprotectant transport system permease protein
VLALVVEGVLVGLQWLVVSRGLRRNPTSRRDRRAGLAKSLETETA